MKQKIIVLFALLLATQNSFAIKLDEQIKQNVDEAKKSYEQLINQESPTLWIHARTEQQRQLLQHIADWLKPISLIKIEPIQIVKDGPKKNQLRFFSSQDKQEADDLLQNLQKIFPQLELQDLSGQYGTMSWMQTGHFELWLAPDLKKVQPPPAAKTAPPAPAPVRSAPVRPAIRPR